MAFWGVTNLQVGVLVRSLRALARSENGNYPVSRALALSADQAKPPWTLGSYIQHGTWAGRRNFTPPARTEGVVSVAVRRGKLKVVTPERSKGVAQEAMKKLLFQVKVDRKLGLCGRAAGRVVGAGRWECWRDNYHWGGRGEK